MTRYWKNWFICQRSIRIKVGTEILKNPKVFIDHSQTIDDVYKI